MAKGKVSEDVVKMIVEADTSKIQQEIHKTNKSLKDLQKERKSLLEQQAAFKAAHLTESKEYAELTRKITKNTQAIADENANLLSLTKTLGTNAMTMSQLRNEAKLLQKQLDSTSKELEPEAYAEYTNKLKEVTGRMAELRSSATSLKEVFLSKTNMGFLMGSGIIGAVSKGLDIVVGLAGTAISKTKEMVNEGIEMAKSADGITHAFERLNRPDILDKLREATHGTVNDVELMKAAVKAKDFRLPLDQLGKYLEFAQLKASQTGQSVDYMTESIITGLGRKSPMILDNLGISAAQIKEEMAKGGDMATAVGRIIEQQLAAQGEHYEDAAEREKRAVTEVQNAQKELGDEMLPLAEKGNSMWQTIQVAALRFFTYLVKAFKQGIAKFVDLYNASITVRSGISLLTTSFKVLWTAIKFVFGFTTTAMKTFGKQIMSLGKMVDGVFTIFTGNIDEGLSKIKNGFTGIFTNMWEGIRGQWKNFEDSGFELGHHLIQGYRDAVDGHITAPSFDSGGSSVPLPDSDPESPAPSSDKPQKAKKTKDTSAAEDRERMKALKQARQKELDEQKYFYEESVRIYKKQLADKQISQEQFDAIMANLQVAQTDQQVATEKAYLEKIMQMEFNSADLRKAAITEQERNILKAENDSYNARTVAYQKYQDNLQQLENGGMNRVERMEYEHQLQLKSLEGYYKASLQYAQEHNEELLSIDLAYQQAKERLEKDYTERLEQEKFQIRQQYGLVSQAELWEQQKEQLQQQYEEGLLNEDEYQQALKQLKMDHWKEAFDYYHQLFSDAVNALMEAEIANVDAKYDAEIDAARKAGKDTTALENKKANEKLKIEKKYADVRFAIKASEIIANTAMSIMVAFAQLGPIGGAIAAALLSVTGIAQLAAANAERQKVKSMTLNGAGSSGSGGARVATGREEGGWLDVEREQDGKRFHAKYDPKKRGYVNQPTVIVGEGPRPKEWIASNEAVENPTIAPFINVLDRVQRAGQLRTFDFNKYLRRQQAQGYADGGSISGQSPMQPQAQQSADTAHLKRLADILERIDRDGVPAYVGLDEFDAKQNIRNRSRNLAKKG
jgi:hypothetical protein